MLGIFISLVNFLSFLSGIVFGVFLATATVLYFVSNKNNNNEQRGAPNTSAAKPVGDGSKTNLLKNKPPVPLAKEDADRINSIIDILGELNSPLKNLNPMLQKIQQNTINADISTLETKMKVIIESPTISRLEKEFQDSLGELKDQAKQVKLLSSFLSDVSKYFQSFSKDLAKLSTIAKTNLHKGSASIECKQDVIVNNWWQLLMTAFDHMSTDYQEFVMLINDDVLNYSNQVQDEIIMIDKRLTAEGNKHFGLLRDNLNLFESKRKERDKAFEKLRNTPVPQGMTNRLESANHSGSSNADGTPHTRDRSFSFSSTTSSLSTTPVPSSTSSASNTAIETYQRRYIKHKASEENFKVQTRRLYEIQKDFYLMFPRFYSDIQITVIKSIVETQSQLLKFNDGLKKLQTFHQNITTKMQLSLTNAAASFVQMLQQENKLLLDVSYHKEKEHNKEKEGSTGQVVGQSSVEGGVTGEGGGAAAAAVPGVVPGKQFPSVALEVMKQTMFASGVKGYELTLHKVLEGLMIQSQLRDVSAPVASSSPSTTAKKSATVVSGQGVRYDSNGNDLTITSNGTISSTTSPSAIPAVMGGDIESSGRLNMYTEATACLAAHNPQLLPQLPKYFHQSIGIETCIWFNAFSGRVYRDIANSDYFYHWFCSKVGIMLNKQENKEKLPDYIDKFEVGDVVFGELPPLLLNMKWSPYHNRKKTRMEGSSEKATSNGNNPANPAASSTTAQEEEEEEEGEEDKVELAEDEDSDEEAEGGGGGTGGGGAEESTSTSTDAHGNVTYSYKGKLSAGLKKLARSTKSNKHKANAAASGATNDTNPPANDGDDESYYYAACTADLAFRSGIKFTVKTKLWINWPRDRYASVPILFHMDLAELSGKIKFGVTRSYSFVTFLEDPMVRINVRSEIGNAKYKLNDIPQVSDYIVRKLKSLIHKRFVYPHAHKFRLIWPRNWWPAGTEHLFVPPGGLPPEEAGARFRATNPANGAGGVSATEAPAASTTASAAANTTSEVEGNTISVKKSSSSTSVLGGSKEKEKEEEVVSNRKSRTYSMTGVPLPVTTTATAVLTNSEPSLSSASMSSKTTPKKALPLTPPQQKLHTYLLTLAQQSLSTSATMSNTNPAQVTAFMIHHKRYTTLTMTLTSYDDYFLSPAAYTLLTTNMTPGITNPHQQHQSKQLRRYTLSDFRSAAIAEVSQDVLLRYYSLHQQQQQQGSSGSGGSGIRKSPGQRGGNATGSGGGGASSASTSRVSRRSTMSSLDNNNNDEGKGFNWFSKDSYHKYKAKFQEMKNKHFGSNTTGTTSGSTSGAAGTSTTTAGAPGGSNTTTTSSMLTPEGLAAKANKLGDKLADFLFNEEGASTATATGGGGGAGGSDAGVSPMVSRRRRPSEDHGNLASPPPTRATIILTSNPSTSSSAAAPSGGSGTAQLERRDSLSSFFGGSSSGGGEGRRRKSSFSGYGQEEDGSASSSSAATGGTSKVSSMKNMVVNMFRSSTSSSHGNNTNSSSSHHNN